MTSPRPRPVLRRTVDFSPPKPLVLDAEEVWRQSPEFPDFAVSTRGRVMRLTEGPGTWPGRLLKPYALRTKRGPLTVYFVRKEQWRTARRPSSLVRDTFCAPGPLPPLVTIRPQEAP